MLNPSRTPQHRRQQSSISRPIPVPNALPAHTSPPTSPRPTHKARMPSVTSPISWLARASSSSSMQSIPYAPSRPVRISEPRFANPIEASAYMRTGVLGAGATVVRTPQEALAGPRASTPSPEIGLNVRSSTPPTMTQVEYGEHINSNHRPGSPPLPPIPDNDESEYIEDNPDEVSDSDTLEWNTTTMPVPSNFALPSSVPPTLPSIPDFESDLTPLLHSTIPLRPRKVSSEQFPPVPPLPTGVVTSPPQSPFSAILVSPAPNSSLDPSRIIVSLETSTITHRTTMSTLTSRPSHLASYLWGLFPQTENDTQSVYSTSSEPDSMLNSIFQYHLSSSGVLSQASTILHIFLDRPSSPYAHILTYLRSPPPTADSPATLPHGVRLSGSSTRLEGLLELRDEACYLGLDELHRLCTEEIRHRHRPSSTTGLGLGLHMRGLSNASSKSLHTLRDGPEGHVDHKSGQRKSDDSGFASGGANTRKSGSSVEDTPWPSPPELKQRLALSSGSPKKDHFASLKPKPTGAWI